MSLTDGAIRASGGNRQAYQTCRLRWNDHAPSIESRERGLPGFGAGLRASAIACANWTIQFRHGSNRQNETSLPIIYSPNIRIPIPAFIKSHNLPTQ
ncbi:hypothetical protein [Burkholderia cepacia]|uniref:hypothetical protein n=1 Tax=Burkholderia cepacia TaxID=292 RepID=UPI000F5E04F1|nr:hypothetical protein [Burkholderia cepacia]MCA8027975.1 hypothetical protein [Burkholderia cepacia]